MVYIRADNQKQWYDFLDLLEPLAMNVFPRFKFGNPKKADGKKRRLRCELILALLWSVVWKNLHEDAKRRDDAIKNKPHQA